MVLTPCAQAQSLSFPLHPTPPGVEHREGRSRMSRRGAGVVPVALWLLRVSVHCLRERRSTLHAHLQFTDRLCLRLCFMALARLFVCE